MSSADDSDSSTSSADHLAAARSSSHALTTPSIQTIWVPIPEHEKILLRDTVQNNKIWVNAPTAAIHESITDLFNTWYWALFVMMKFSSHFGPGAEAYGPGETPETHLARVFHELSASNGAEDSAELRDANPTIIPPLSFEQLRFSVCEDELDLWMLILQMYRRLPAEFANINRTSDGFTITQLCRSFELLEFRPDNSSKLEECISSIPKAITQHVPPLHYETKPGDSAEHMARLGFHKEYLEFVPYSEFQDIILISDINAVESTLLPDIGLWVPDMVRANVSRIARWPSSHRSRMYPLVDRRVVREQELCSAKPFQDSSPRHVLLCNDIPSGVFRRKDFWDEYSDCALTTHPDTKEAILVQSFDGFKYRYFLAKYGRANALRSITLLLDSPHNMSTLREQLGEEFQKDYGHSIEWIHWECFSDITFIAQGACGRVFRANWTPLMRKDGRRRYSEDSRKRTTIPVALKSLRPIPKSIMKSWFNELFTTVMVNDDFGIVQLLGISKVPEGIPVPNGLQTGNFVLVSKFAEMGTLQEVLRTRRNAFPLNWLTKITLAEGIAVGLDKIHNMGFVHGDLHGCNVMCMNEPESGTLDPANAPVNKVTSCGIIDMGQSLLIGALQQGINVTTPISAPRYVVGSPMHTAPELYSSFYFSKASDMYALGVLMWQIASCQDAEALRPGEAPVPFEVPEEFQQLYNRCWGPPEQRPSAREVWLTLQELWGEFMDCYDDDGNPTGSEGAKMVIDSKASLPFKDVILLEDELDANSGSPSKKHRLGDGVSLTWHEWHANLSQ